jgi:S-adenosylmethionine decarboxylase
MILEVLARAARKAGATVISQVRYRFGEDSPPGCAAMVLLDESHCSAHSYADLGLLAIDVFTCGTTDPHEVLRQIVFDLKLEDFDVREFSRFEKGDETKPMTKAGAVSTT